MISAQWRIIILGSSLIVIGGALRHSSTHNVGGILMLAGLIMVLGARLASILGWPFRD
jgi:hypothetical protein